MTWLTIAAALFLGLAWAAFLVLQILTLRQVRRLDDLLDLRGAGPTGAPSRLPPLSVVVTARNEEGSIESTVRRLLAQRYPGLEIIAVDDRSTDRTGPLLDRLAAASLPEGPGGGAPAASAARLTPLHLEALPDGWLGKCHACHAGAARARGEWILFMDGDVELMPDDLLRHVVAHAEGARLDHVAIVPDSRPMSALQSAVLGVFGQLFFSGALAHEIDRDRRRGGAGVGAFNLVRRRAYEAIGGHSLLRMDPGDDFKLGRLLKESGARQRIYDGVNLVRCPWHRGVLQVVRGLEKNFFAGLDYSLARLFGLTAVALLLYFGPPALALASRVVGPSGWSGAAAVAPLGLQLLALSAAALAQSARQGGSPPLRVALYPIALLVLLGAAWNSAFWTLRRGGIVWRETFYPLAALRRGLVRPGTGRRLHGRAGGGLL